MVTGGNGFGAKCGGSPVTVETGAAGPGRPRSGPAGPGRLGLLREVVRGDGAASGATDFQVQRLRATWGLGFRGEKELGADFGKNRGWLQFCVRGNPRRARGEG